MLEGGCGKSTEVIIELIKFSTKPGVKKIYFLEEGIKKNAKMFHFSWKVPNRDRGRIRYDNYSDYVLSKVLERAGRTSWKDKVYTSGRDRERQRRNEKNSGV